MHEQGRRANFDNNNYYLTSQYATIFAYTVLTMARPHHEDRYITYLTGQPVNALTSTQFRCRQMSTATGQIEGDDESISANCTSDVIDRSRDPPSYYSKPD